MSEAEKLLRKGLKYIHDCKNRKLEGNEVPKNLYTFVKSKASKFRKNFVASKF
jgi:hypothetical protein